MNFIEWAQARLIAHGFNPGTPDGIWGRNTLNATIAFQQARGIPPSGALNQATVVALRAIPGVASPATDRTSQPPTRDLLDFFPWITLALRKKGLHEGRDNVELRKFLKSDGKTLGDPARLPWCGDFVETCIAVSLPEAVLPNNPYLARNWQYFGASIPPCFGSILIFWRGSRNGTSGHVGFYYSEDDDFYHVLGGNQSNSICIAKLDKGRLLGAQLPLVGGPYPRKVVKSKTDFTITTNEA